MGDGSFVNPIELGRVTTDVSGTINGVIPADLAEGTYKVRVVSTNYPMESNEADITIKYPYVPVPEVEIVRGEFTAKSIEATFTPNADCVEYYFLIAPATETVDAEYIKANGELKSESYTATWENLMPNTNYTIYALPIDIEDNEGTVNTLVVKTRVEAGVSEIDIDVEKLNETTVTITATPNENTVLYHYIVITKDEADAMGEDALMQKLNENENYIDSVADVYTMTVESNVAYYVIAQGKNVEGMFGAITKVEFMVEYTDTTAVAEFDEAMFEIYPNPASEYVRITSDVEIESLMIFSVDGKMIYSQEVNQEETMIDLTGFAKGSYIVKILSNDIFVVRRIIVR